MGRRWLPALALACLALAALAIVAAVWLRPRPEVEAVAADTRWRVFAAGANGALAPPSDWASPRAGMIGWARRRGEVLGGYGYWQPQSVGLLCLRAAFEVKDRDDVRALSLRVLYRGGAIAYLNGREAGRGHVVPADGDSAAGEPYPREAYVEPDGRTLLPRTDRPSRDFPDRYELRVRAMDLKLSPGMLRDGENVLAIAVYRAGDPPFLADEPGWLDEEKHWSTPGFYGARLALRGGRVPSRAAAPAGVEAWNADTLEAIPAEGLNISAEAGPPGAVRMAGPRNGVCSGQAVVSCPGGVRGVSARIGELARAGGGAIPADRVRLRYAVQEGGYCDTLSATPADGARAQPVWVIVEVPADQEPGSYSGELEIRAGDRVFRLPVDLRVCPWTLPKASEYATHVSLLHSPDTLALRYGAAPYSDRHFDLIERSLELMGRVGNDVVYIPVVRNTHLGNNTGMIRWTEDGAGYRPEFEAFDRFLDLYGRRVGEPKALCLDVWHEDMLKGTPPAVTLLDRGTGAMTRLEAPAYGSAGSEEFWKPMMDGVLRRVAGRQWSPRCVMVGVACDKWPRRETIDFFRKIAPGARWTIFSHGRDRPVRGTADAGRLIVGSGMEIGYYESPFTPDPSTESAPEKIEYLKATSMRYAVTDRSHPVAYRNLADLSVNGGCQGFGRIGLDYWEIDGRALIGRYRDWHKLYRFNPRAVAAAGPDGACETVRFQMLREGVQEAEARILIAGILGREDAASALGGELHARCRELLAARAGVRALAAALPEAQAGHDWVRLTAELYDAASAAADAVKARGGAGQGKGP